MEGFKCRGRLAKYDQDLDNNTRPSLDLELNNNTLQSLDLEFDYDTRRSLHLELDNNTWPSPDLEQSVDTKSLSTFGLYRDQLRTQTFKNRYQQGPGPGPGAWQLSLSPNPKFKVIIFIQQVWIQSFWSPLLLTPSWCLEVTKESHFKILGIYSKFNHTLETLTVLGRIVILERIRIPNSIRFAIWKYRNYSNIFE